MRRVLVAAETIKGRHHAAWGIEDDSGKIIAPRKMTRALCGVPVMRFARRFGVDTTDQGCQYCNRTATTIYREEQP